MTKKYGFLESISVLWQVFTTPGSKTGALLRKMLWIFGIILILFIWLLRWVAQ